MKKPAIRKRHAREFWDNVKFEDNHWVWTGMADKKGGTPRWYDGDKTLMAGREAWRRIHGEPSGVLVRFCKHKRCVNPAHYDLLDMNIWRYVAKEKDGCWYWLGRMKKGKPVWADKVHHDQDVIRQHSVVQMVWKMSGRELVKGEQLVRRCYNQRCVNPAHCEPMSAAGLGKFARTSPRIPVVNPMAKVNRMQVEKMRVMFKAKTHTISQIALRYGIDYTTVWDIVHYRKWKLAA